ncbi:c-Myc-binding protein [Chelonus insularis]|uniref:c-Myc-binding protein n=1 Tax=Chelonus insularis TaxID=460826 RepID=UPI00158C4987|nr:c-Myc-binding protein-like [Chelonus insularis]
MASYKPNESKREEFRRYLERAGVLDALAKILVSLYEEPEKPADALEYVRKQLVNMTKDNTEPESDLEKKLENAEAENRELREKLAKLDLSVEE